MGELGPVDPSVTNAFNPILAQEDIQGTAPPKPRPRIPISVEDVASYLNFAKSRGGLEADGMAQAFSALTQNVHPLALGNILRHHNLIRHLARTLLLMHLDAEADKDKLDSIVRKLTEELYSHEYTITGTRRPVSGLTLQTVGRVSRNKCGRSTVCMRNRWALTARLILRRSWAQRKQKYLCFDSAMIENDATALYFCTKGFASRKGAAEFEFNSEAQGWEK